MAFNYRSFFNSKQSRTFLTTFATFCGCGTVVGFSQMKKPLNRMEGSGNRFLSDGFVSDELYEDQRIFRSSRAIQTFIFNSIDYKYSHFKFQYLSKDEEGSKKEYEKMRSEVHLRSARRILRLCEKNKGIYIKAGQFLSTIQKFPKEYTNTLTSLQDQVKAQSFDSINRVFLEEFGKNAHEIFESFDEEAIAAASLSQVHRAILKKTKQKVAVKIQYPKLKEQIENDLETIKFLVHAVSLFFPEFKIDFLVPEFEDNIKVQLNFVLEGKNAEKTEKLFKNNKYLKIPKINWEYTSGRVLTMEFIKGCKIDDVDKIKEQNIDPKEVGKALLEIFGESIFLNSFFHADPHPGNILIQKRKENENEIENENNNKYNNENKNENTKMERGRTSKKENFHIVLLDHGLYQSLDEEFRTNFCCLWTSFMRRDTQNSKKIAQKMKLGEIYPFLPLLFNPHAVRKGDEANAQIRHRAKNISIVQISKLFSQIPNQMFLLLRTDRILQSILHKLEFPLEERILVYSKYAILGKNKTEKINNSHNEQKSLNQHFFHSNLENLNLILRLEMWKLAFQVYKACIYFFHQMKSSWERFLLNNH